jgi:hypothetical protein
LEADVAELSHDGEVEIVRGWVGRLAMRDVAEFAIVLGLGGWRDGFGGCFCGGGGGHGDDVGVV